MPHEPENNNLPCSSSATERNKSYLNTLKASMQALQINSELQNQLKDGNSGQYKFHNDADTKCIVALLSIQPDLYPKQLTFKNYSLQEIRNNMKKLRKQAFSKMDACFIKDLLETLISFVNKHIDDIKTKDKFVSTLKETLQIEVYEKYSDIKKLIPTFDELENQISSKTLSILDVDDKLVFLNFFETILTTLINNAIEIAKIMGIIRNNELIAHAQKLEALDSSIKLDELWFTQPIRLSSPDNIAFLKPKDQDKVKSILANHSQEYIKETEEKGDSSKRKIFNDTKAKIEQSLCKFLSPEEAAQICENLTYANTISSPVMNYRTFWQERTSEDLLKEALEYFLDPDKIIEYTTMTGTCDELREVLEEIREESEIPLPPIEQLIAQLVETGFLDFLYELTTP